VRIFVSMKQNRIILILLCGLFIGGCHDAYSTMFYSRAYSRTDNVQVFIEAPPAKPYDEIGRVVAEGSAFTSRETLLKDAIEEAQRVGAEGLIKLEFYYDEFYDSNGNVQQKPRIRGIMIRFKDAQ
jgi:hypothetical protein